MPPDPILALLCLAGLLLYAIIGGIVTAVVLRVAPGDDYYDALAGKRGYLYWSEIWATVVALTLFWPVVVALAIPAALLVGPLLLAMRVTKYVAKSEILEGS